MVEKNLKKLKAKKRRVMNGFNTGTRDMKLKTAYQRKKMVGRRCRPLFLYDVMNVCGWIRTTGAFPHTSLAGRHHKPLGHANISGQGWTRTNVDRSRRIYSPLQLPLCDLPV